MKKTFAMLLALCLCCSCLFDAGAACADGGEGGAGADPEMNWAGLWKQACCRRTGWRI